METIVTLKIPLVILVALVVSIIPFLSALVWSLDFSFKGVFTNPKFTRHPSNPIYKRLLFFFPWLTIQHFEDDNERKFWYGLAQFMILPSELVSYLMKMTQIDYEDAHNAVGGLTVTLDHLFPESVEIQYGTFPFPQVRGDTRELLELGIMKASGLAKREADSVLQNVIKIIRDMLEQAMSAKAWEQTTVGIAPICLYLLAASNSLVFFPHSVMLDKLDPGSEKITVVIRNIRKGEDYSESSQ